MGQEADRRHLSQAVSELISRKGLAQVRGHAELESVWREVAGDDVAARTRVLGIRRGVLNVGVAHAPLLGELASFRKAKLLQALQRKHAGWNIRDVKFRLRGDLQK